jgi:menaquinone-specific isochorismate synthase
MALPTEGFLFEYAPGRLLVGEGPCEALPERRSDRVACYAPDFRLDDPAPWHHPTAIRETTRDSLLAELGSPRSPAVRWDEPDAAAYAATFDSAMRRIADGELIKAVPIVLETGHWNARPPVAVAGLVAAVLAAPGPTLAYGVWSNDTGMVGASPEVLFTRSGGCVRTVALAGTFPAERAAAILDDPKESREHQNVVDDIVGALAPLGPVTVGPREILRLPGLAHLKTDIHATVAEPTPFTAIVEALHPTAALGVFPRSAGLSALGDDGPHGRGRFGAPFGIEWPDGRASVLVAIRNVQWTGRTVLLGAGAGLIAESRFEAEWAELALKRATVKGMLGL